MIRRASLLFVLLSGLTAQAALSATGAAELDQGFFCAMETVATESAQDTVSGTVNLVDSVPVFIGPGPTVPARLGVGFGVMVQVPPQMAGVASVQIDHPPMGPKAVTRQTWSTLVSGVKADYLGYTFEYPYELLRGRWTMSARVNGQVLYSVSFTVVDPAQMPWVTCGEQIPLS